MKQFHRCSDSGLRTTEEFSAKARTMCLSSTRRSPSGLTLACRWENWHWWRQRQRQKIGAPESRHWLAGDFLFVFVSVFFVLAYSSSYCGSYENGEKSIVWSVYVLIYVPVNVMFCLCSFYHPSMLGLRSDYVLFTFDLLWSFRMLRCHNDPLFFSKVLYPPVVEIRPTNITVNSTDQVNVGYEKWLSIYAIYRCSYFDL